MASNATKLLTILGTTVVIILLDWLFVTYATAHGLQGKTQVVTFGSSSYQLPLPWFPVAGLLLVSLVTWYEVYSSMFPRRGVAQIDPLTRFRLFRTIVVSVALFVCLLYVPYIIGSNWFWERLGETSRNISQIRDFANGLLGSGQGLMTANPIWQYSLAQFLATGAMIIAAWALGRVVRRPRKLK